MGKFKDIKEGDQVIIKRVVGLNTGGWGNSLSYSKSFYVPVVVKKVTPKRFQISIKGLTSTFDKEDGRGVFRDQNISKVFKEGDLEPEDIFSSTKERGVITDQSLDYIEYTRKLKSILGLKNYLDRNEWEVLKQELSFERMCDLSVEVTETINRYKDEANEQR